MNTDIKEIKDRLERIEKVLLPYPLRNLLDCHIDFDLKLRALYPSTQSQSLYIEQLGLQLKASLYEDIKNMEQKINKHLRLYF